MPLDDRTKTAFTFAQESTKQMITLATGVIALTITFSKDIAGSVDQSARAFMLLSWIAFLVSVVFGVWTMLALTGTLEPGPDASTEAGAANAGATGVRSAPPAQQATIRGRNVTVPSMLQIVTFISGLLFAVVFAGRAL
jgi:hypothetical protein